MLPEPVGTALPCPATSVASTGKAQVAGGMLGELGELGLGEAHPTLTLFVGLMLALGGCSTVGWRTPRGPLCGSVVASFREGGATREPGFQEEQARGPGLL